MKRILVIGFGIGVIYLLVLLLTVAVAINPGVGEGEDLDAGSFRFRLGVWVSNHIYDAVTSPLTPLTWLVAPFHTNVVSWWLIIPYFFLLGVAVSALCHGVVKLAYLGKKSP